jgi:hypothetical protein
VSVGQLIAEVSEALQPLAVQKDIVFQQDASRVSGVFSEGG